MANSKGVTGRKACTMIRAAFCLAFFTYLCCSKVTYCGINFLCIFWTRFQACLQQMPLFLFRLSKKVNIIVTVEWTTKAFEKKNPEKKFRLGWESNPDLYIGRTQCSIHWANQASWRANRCDRVAMVREKSRKNENYGKGKVRENLWYCQSQWKVREFCFLVYSS